MLNILETNGCVKCYSVIKSGFEKRLIPCKLETGVTGHQTRTAFAYFDVGNRDSELYGAVLRIFLLGTRLCGSRETVSIRPVLPCGAPLAVGDYASLEVSKSICGWRTVNILPLITAARRELGDAPFGLVLSVAAPSLVVFSAETATRPRLMLDWRGVPEEDNALSGCPCADAVDICAPISCACCAKSSGIRVESQSWHIDFEGEDASVVRRVDRIKEGTFFITNVGENEMLTTVETGCDSSRWVYDTQKSIAPGETQAIVAKFYGRYYRLVLTAAGEGKAVIEFIGQYYT